MLERPLKFKATMNSILEHLITVFFGYFAIMNPLANTAVFVGLTGNTDKNEKIKIAIKSLVITFGIIVLFAVLGKTLFHFFGITLHALRITGGILVFIIGYHMLHGEGSSLHTSENSNQNDIAISPLAVPILAGPGTIATTMSFSASGGWTDISITLSVFALLCGITFVCFILGQRVLNLFGKNGLQIITRLMGLILAIIGIQMLVEGIYGAVEAYPRIQG
jgi:multiple antibiotic resistance protein